MKRYRRRRFGRRRRRFRIGRGIPKVLNGKIYFGRDQRGRGGLSRFAAKLIANVGDAIGI